MAAQKKAQNGEPSLADLKKRHTKAKKLLADARALFAEAHELPKDDRRRSQGRLGADESVAMRGVIGAMESEPAVFVSLADFDGGNDPQKLETALLRERLDRYDLYQDIAEEAESLARLFADQALSVGALVVPVVRAGYEIAKPVSKTNPKVRAKISKMLDYHGANAQAAQASRKANKTKKAPVDA
ncbi:hypothetical protein A7982_13175 [Minicystis rosea]|nr:hypothetical protein A7982_13175 [Minicystis rosea]